MSSVFVRSSYPTKLVLSFTLPKICSISEKLLFVMSLYLIHFPVREDGSLTKADEE